MNTKARTHIAIFTLGALLALPATARAADSYTVDPVHSTVIFKVKHFGVGFQYGSFRKVSGALVVDEAKPARSSVTLDVDAASVFTANKKRDKHLRGPDFLNVKQFPKISFISTKIRRSGKELTVKGKLTLHGVTKPVTVRMLFNLYSDRLCPDTPRPGDEVGLCSLQPEAWPEGMNQDPRNRFTSLRFLMAVMAEVPLHKHVNLFGIFEFAPGQSRWAYRDSFAGIMPDDDAGVFGRMGASFKF